MADERIHEIAAPVPAIPCFGIYADYDGNAPDTENVWLVATEDLAKEFLEVLNRDPRACVRCVVDGWEHVKVWSYCPAFASVQGHVFTTLSALVDAAELGDPEDDGEPAPESEDEG